MCVCVCVCVCVCFGSWTYRDIILTALAAKIYNALLLNRITHEVEKFLGKNRNGFRRNRSQILIIRRIIEGVRVKNLDVTVFVTVYP